MTMPDKLNTLLDTVTDTDKVELKIHHNASVACLKAYNEEPTAAKKKDLDAAQEGLQNTIDRMWAQYFPDEERFENAKQAMAHLRHQGYKIAKSKFYKDRGKTLKVQVDGSIYRRDLDLYAKTLKFLGDPSAGLDAAQKEKAEWEARKLKEQVAKLEIERKALEGKYVPREEADLARAASISVVEANVRNMHATRAAQWIDLVRGDAACTGELIDAMRTGLDETFNALVNAGEFEVEVEAPGET